jgi:iron complex outermembrane receptor protein
MSLRPFHPRLLTLRLLGGAAVFVLFPAGVVLASPTVAPTPASAPGPEPEPAPEPPPAEVVVQGRSPTPVRGASDLVIPIGNLAKVPRKNATEMLELAPGMYLTSEGGEGHAERIYLRGFDAREGQDLELTVDGVPINESGNLHGAGFADPHFLIPELVQSLRVLEGPFDPRQGNFAVAGSARYELGLGRRGITATYGRGSFGAERALVTFGPPGESAHTFAGADLFRTSGFGKNRSARHGRAMAQYEGRLGSAGSFRFGGAAYATDFRSAGLVRAEDVARGRIERDGTYDPRQGGSGSRFQLMADVETRAGGFVLYQQLFAIRRTLGLRENFTGFLLDTQRAIQSPHGQRGDLLDLSIAETTFGGRGFARTGTKLGGLAQEVEVGYFARGDATEATRQRIAAASGHPYVTEVSLESDLADFGIYGDVALRPVRGVTLRGGARADLFTYDVLDRCAAKDVSLPNPDDPPGDASCLDQERGGEHREPNQRSATAATNLMPRASLSFGPLAHFTATLGWGKGVRSVDPSYISDGIATPFAEIEAAEGGVVFARSFEALSVTARSVFFHTHVDRDLAFSETEGRAVLGGGTSRTGWTGAARLAAGPLDENASVTLVRSTFDDTGLLVPYAPAVVVRSDSALDAELPFDIAGARPGGSLALGLGYVGRRALPYGQETASIFLVDASAGVSYRAWALDLEVTNVLDARHRTAEYFYVSDFRSSDAPTLVPARHYAAGSPRAMMLSLSMTVGGEP